MFISYAHKDVAHLNTLLAWLKEQGFQDREIWYDNQSIEGGDNWRDEITTALDSAYVIIVIVTENSMKSPYCIYEWAYAMGQGAPVIPLAFEEINYLDILDPFRTTQIISCLKQIPLSLKSQISQYESIPPQVAAIKQQVFDIIEDTHRRFFILGWVGSEIRHSDDYTFSEMFKYFVNGAIEAHRSLENLMTDKAFAFSGRYYRSGWLLVNFLHDFSILRQKFDEYLWLYLYPKFDTEWLPAYQNFDVYGDHWNRWIRKFFERNLDNERAKGEILMEVARVFPTIDYISCEGLINTKIWQLKRADEIQNGDE